MSNTVSLKLLEKGRDIITIFGLVDFSILFFVLKLFWLNLLGNKNKQAKIIL